MMTFSIVARDSVSGDIGIAVASKFPAVGSVVPWISLDGAVATQALANLEYGRTGLRLLNAGASAQQVLNILLENDEGSENRQIGIVDKWGNSMSFTGDECYPWAGGISGESYAIQGNILVGEQVVSSMESVYLRTPGDLAEKLLSALEAGDAAGGDKRGKQSAHLIVFRKNGGYGGGSDVYVDVRVDDHPEAVSELRRVFEVYSLCLLEREDPIDVSILNDELYYKIGEKLSNSLHIKLDSIEEIQAAFHQWMHTENFENKIRDDGKVWNSILNYLFNLY